MSAFYIISFIVFLLLSDRVQSVTWSASSLQDGHQLYACAGNNVTLTWKYTMNTGEELIDVQWLYDGHSQELVAMFSHSTFLPTPSFSQRVTLVDNAGITLSNVLVADSGNYSVRVNIENQNGALHALLHTLLLRTVTLHVSDHLLTTDGALHVVQDPDPVYNNVTGQWVIQLQCGHFIFQGNPPFYVEWTTPSGRVHNSTSYNQGIFNFHIPMPVETGNYVCSIPANMTARACLYGNVSQSRVAVRVESMEARLLLLEKENWDLKHKLASSDINLIALQTRMSKLEDAERNQVAFHAIELSTGTPPVNTPMMFNRVVYNQGNGYNSSTGYFTTPYSGLYFFIAKTATYGIGTHHSLMVDSNIIDTAFTVRPTDHTDPEQSPVHGVVHLTKGQRVWVSIDLNSGMYSDVSSFTGFLLSRDP